MIGRFAPSPTGPLHFGSLVAALGSYLTARSKGGEWLVRIENIDPPRERPGAARAQIETLRRHGLNPTRPIVFQSHCHKAHRQALDRLVRLGRVFPCACSRSDLPADGIYPGTCRAGLGPGKRARSMRFRVDNRVVRFTDAVRGTCEHNPHRQSGDFVVRRADGLIAYQLAVVVDDANAGVTEVVRGSDLLDTTARQILIHQALGLTLPAYAHLPLVVDDEGRKLSKSERADPVDQRRPAETVRLALRALGHEPPPGQRSLAAMLSWAEACWRLDQVPPGPVTIGMQPA